MGVPDVAFIIDTPTQLAATDGPPRSRIQVAELGTYKDPRYGDFAITAAEVANWSKLLADYFQGRVPIDIDHATDKGGSSEAAAWITGLSRDGNEVFADVEWTPKGESAVKEKRYLYISPTFVSDFKDTKGQSRGPALLRAALTNNPFLRQMPAVSLSADLQPAERIGDPPDSRPVMPDLLKTLAATFGLDEGADEAKVLDAAKSAKAKADAPPKSTDTKTLVAQAKAEGLVLLTQVEHDRLNQSAADGTNALEQMKTDRFERTFDGCLKKLTVDAKPETRTEWKELYDAAPDTTIKRLEALAEPVANGSARGEGGDHSEPVTTLNGHNVDPDSVKLDKQVKDHMKDKGVDYPTALSAVLSDAEGMVL